MLRMQSQQSSRIDLNDLKAQIVKRIGPEKSKRYFYYLNMLLSQKLSKKDFDKQCCRLLGAENFSLHNQFIRSILKNACQAKTPPPSHLSGPLKLGTQASNSSFDGEDGHQQGGAVLASQSQNLPVWSNGVLPLSPRKGRSGIRDRKLNDRPSPLGPNGKIDVVTHPAVGCKDNGNKIVIENGVATPCDYQRLVQHLQPVAELPESERDAAFHQPAEKPRMLSKDHVGASLIEEVEEAGKSNQLNFSRSSLIAPLGIPLCPASVGGARKAEPVGGGRDVVRYCDSGGLSDTETLRKRVEQITAAQGLGGISLECANMLNNMLDVYLKRLIRSCVHLVGARSSFEPKKNPTQKQQIQGKIVNGMSPNNHLQIQKCNGPIDAMQDHRPQCSVSLFDFKVAMELNPQQLGEDWPLLLEKICMHAFEE